jgi:predicted DCC family thiol-disulfide oxidoreductase YuxK
MYYVLGIMQPLLIFDGNCGFCRTWVERWKRKTSDNVRYAPYQDVASQFPEVPLHEFEAAVQFVEEGEGGKQQVTSGAEAVFRLLRYGGKTFPLWCYTSLPGFKLISESVYRLVAAHRARKSCGVHRK